ncbi:MAG: hypothetical protein ABSB00_02940 [Minisyncoccia bacterium]|jgi:hypothetical protein
MDEILIEEKKYVSSKRAAKMTGYAKDYIGQLCREGRVPARLIGRNWYVLEAAIQDHKFGKTEIKSKEPVKAISPALAGTPVLSPTWESPRYEASSEELLPSMNRLKDTEKDIVSDDTSVNNEGKQNISEHIQDSWKAWFDRFNHMGDAVEPIVSTMPEVPEKIEEKPEIEESANINVPIHALYRPFYQSPPEELLPRNIVAKPLSNLRETRTTQRGSKRATRIIQVFGTLLAVLAAAFAVIGSGYFDKYVLSSSPTEIIAGVELYNK